MNLYVRFERGRDDIIGPTFGPYDFVQLTYDELRVEAGDEADIALAEFIDEDQEWRINEQAQASELKAGRADFLCHNAEHGSTSWYSDIIIFPGSSSDSPIRLLGVSRNKKGTKV